MFNFVLVMIVVSFVEVMAVDVQLRIDNGQVYVGDGSGCAGLV